MKKVKKIKSSISMFVVLLMLFNTIVISVPKVQAASFVPRDTTPSETSPYWIHTSEGGLNSCVIASGNSVLPNCVGYAWGRAYEILGSEPDLSRLDAGLWFGINQNKYDSGNGGYPYSTDITKPKLGAIVCWSDSNGAGHVAVVERIDGDQITTSESGWNSARFWTTNRSTTHNRLGQKENYTFQGYIYIIDGSSVTLPIKESFPAHCNINITTGSYVKSLPCSKSSDPNSEDREYASKGSTYEAIELVRNNWDNLWYKVKAKSGGEGYIFAGNASYGSQIISDVVGSGFSVPTNHIIGNSYPITGTISSTYNTISSVAAYVYAGNNSYQTQVTGGSESISNNYYNLKGSSVDYKTEFNKLSVGTYTYAVYVSYKNYYAESDKTYSANTGRILLYSATFNVVNSGSTHTHSYTSSITTYPTCISTGVRTYTCSCGASYTETIGTTGHTSVITPEVKPTTTTTGLTQGRHCSVCGVVLEAQQVIPVLPVMSNVKVIEVTREYIKIYYELIKNAHHYEIDIDYIDVNGKVVREATWYSYSAYGNGFAQFSVTDLKNVGSYKITVTPIDYYENRGIGKAVEASVLTDPNIYAKGSCGDNATWILDNDGNLIISGSGTMYDSVFANNQKIKNVVIEEGITSVSRYAFYKCFNLEEVSLPDSLTELGYFAFSATGIESIHIPENVSHITPGFVMGAIKLKSITVDSENKYYSTDGVFLCNKEKTEIVQYPMGLELEYVTIPNNITTVGKLAFHFAFHIKNIDSSTNLKYIGNEAFGYCVGLKSFVMPESVETIGWYAFDCCYQLESVYILSENAEFDDRSMFRRYDKVSGITLDDAYEIAIDLFKNGKTEELFAFPDKYIESLPEVESYGTIYCLKNSSAEIYAKKHGIDYVCIDGIYNLGEDTYSFKDYVDDDSQGGHCFGMAVTSSGYFLGLLDGDTVGLDENNSLYSISDNSDIREPICYYNSIQGKVRNDSIVAGGINLKDYNSYDIESDWDAVIEYVKTNEHNEKGNLVIGCTKKSEGGHAVNFLRYRVVEGQERIYAYDNDFPNVETYFYQDANGKIRQAPQSAFSGELDGIALIDVEKYYELAEEFENVRVRSFYAPANSIAIENAYVSVICDNAVEGEYFMYEVFDDVSTVDVIPLVDNATFVYMGNEYSFDEINEDTYGEFTLPSSETDEPMFEVKDGTHEHIYDESKLEPTCTEPGSITYSCECGDTYTETVEANGHSDSEWIIDRDSTCSVEGLKHIECTVCGESIKAETIATLLHNYDAVVTEATCENGGYTTYICDCGDSYIADNTSATGHSFTDGQSKCNNCDYNKADSCSCKCHKSGLSKIIFKIILIFQKIFKKNRVCEGCGIYHY